MYIFMLLLKIIGILLLLLVGLVCIAVFLLLFVPIRYQVRLQKEVEQAYVMKLRIRWAFPILFVAVDKEEVFSCKVRIFGFLLKGKKGRQQKNRTAPSAKETEKRKTSLGKKEASLPEMDLPQSVPKKTDKEIQSENASQEEINVWDAQKRMLPESDQTNVAEHSAEKEQSDQSYESVRHKVKGIYTKWSLRIQKFIRLVRSLPERIRTLGQNVLTFCGQISDKKENWLGKWNKVIAFLEKKENKAGLIEGISGIKKVLLHVWPKKWSGYVHFGMETPDKTGKVLGLLGVMLGFLERMPELEPDFEQKVLEGRVYAKGRIYGIVLLTQGLHIWRNEKVKKLRVNIEELRRTI